MTTQDQIEEYEARCREYTAQTRERMAYYRAVGQPEKAREVWQQFKAGSVITRETLAQMRAEVATN